MNASQARNKYFDKYIQFEKLVFDIYENTENKKISLFSFSLGETIKKLWENDFLVAQFQKQSLSKKYLLIQKNNRNFLAHTIANKIVNNSRINNFDQIDQINKKLENVLKVL